MHRWTLTLHLLLLFSAVLAAARGGADSQPAQPREYPCPNAAEITPCICTSDPEFQLFMDCSGARTDDELTNAFSAVFPFTTFNDLTIDQTNLDNHNLNKLTQFSFGEVSFEHVDIRGTTLTEVDEGAFQNSHGTLISLHLSNNRISVFTFEIIGEFTKLNNLQLNGNNFNGVPIQPISSASLRLLNLGNNPWINVGGDFVKACPALQTLLMQNTGQELVPILDESPISMLHGLGNIIKVDFSGNTISTLLTETFSPSVAAGTINTLALSANDIAIVFPDFVTGLVGGLDTLIDLSQNSIELLDEAVWRDIFVAVGLGVVDLSDNPLACGCDMAWFVRDTSEIQRALSPETRCYTGNLVSELPEGAFDQCP